ncbi:MAG: glycine cleavage system transcriptional repressor, partial [Alteromonas macleodii]
SLPSNENVDALESDLMSLFTSLNVTGKVVDKQKKDPNENVTSW